MNDTPTPRVDAQADHAGNFHNLASVVDANLARDLERQLAELTDRWERAANAYLIERGKHEETQRQIAEATAWRPIETAPRDGTLIDLWGLARGDGSLGISKHRRFCDCYHIPATPTWNDERWFSRSHGDIKPTHWQPLPNPPTEKP